MHQAEPSAAEIITTFADLHERVVRGLQQCGFALAIVMSDQSALDRPTIEALTTARELLDRVLGDVRSTAFAVRQQLHPRAADTGDGQRRYVVRVEDEVIIAYSDGGHDFRRVHDDSLWAHESDGKLLSARSGTPLARRSGIMYYDVITDLPLYYETS